ncbi:hypothetical protein D3C80_1430830 [compost metagenome]
MHFPVVDHVETVELLTTNPDVLGDAHVRHQVEFLVDHRDPGLQRRQGRFEDHRFAPQAQFAGVRLVDAGDDFHQGGFARAVLAHQGQHGAGAYPQLHVGQGHHPGETLADVDDLQQVRLIDRRYSWLDTHQWGARSSR